MNPADHPSTSPPSPPAPRPGDDVALAYVPRPKTPSRGGGKEKYPLDFYGSQSGGRYPRMRPAAAGAFSERPPPAFAAEPASTSIPRKRVPTSCPPAPPTAPPPAPPTSAPPPPPQPRRQHASAPAGERSRARDDDDDDTIPARFSAQEYAGLLSAHPSTLDDEDEPARPTTPFPGPGPLARTATADTATTTLATITTATTTSSLPTRKSGNHDNNKPAPSLPDFIAPRPAVKQRYFSAGGNAKLTERTEIPGPVYTTPGASAAASMSREEIESRMADPEWVLKNFGEGALGPAGPVTAGRGRSSKDSQQGEQETEVSCPPGVDEQAGGSGGGGSGGRVARLFRKLRKGSKGGEAD